MERHTLLITILLAAAGCGGPQQPVAAAPLGEPNSPLVAACEAGTATSCLVAASDAEQAGDLAEAARLYLMACELRESAGCALAGGALVDADKLDDASDAFAAGCALDDGTACYGQGLVAAGNFGGEPDWGAALGPYEKACELGLAAGCGELANMLSAGNGVAVDIDRGATLRKQACDQGDGESCTRLGLEAWQAKDETMARELFEKSCGTELPDPNGCGYLGWLLWSAATAPDEVRGVAMLDASCGAGSAIGCSLRATVHERLGDHENAALLLKQACELDPENCEAMSKQFEAAKAVPPR